MAEPLVCYTVSNNYVESSNQYFACGKSKVDGASAQACCYAEDYCMEDSICSYTRGGVVNGTGFYMAGCTDSSWQDPACPKQCTSEYDPSIIYDQANSEWRCCESTGGALNCQDPSEFIVKAPGPEDLSTVTQISMSAPADLRTTGIGSITSTSTAVPATSRTGIYHHHTHTTNKQVSPTNHSHASESSPSGWGNAGKDLSNPAQAGLAAGVSLGLIVIISIFFFLLRKYKKKTPKFERHDSTDKRRSTYSLRSAFANCPPPLPSNSVSEVPSITTTQRGSAMLEAAFANRKSLAPSTRSSARRSATPSYISKARKSSHGPSKLRISSAMSLRRDSDSSDRESLHVITEVPKERFSWEGDAGPYEMQSSETLHRVPYERPLSAQPQELQATEVRMQGLAAGPAIIVTRPEEPLDKKAE